MDLETVNAGFARAMDGDECQLAYCQSELYVEYMLALGGSDAPKKMVAAYAENPSTEAAIRKVFGISQAEFETRLQGLSPQADRRHARAGGGRERNLRRTGKGPSPAAQGCGCRGPAGLGLFPAGAKQEAADLAAEALKLQPKQQLATYVLVRLAESGHAEGGDGEAGELSGSQGPRAARAELSGRPEVEGREIRRGCRALCPGRAIGSGESAMAGRSGEGLSGGGSDADACPALDRFARIEPDDLPSRKKLAELALEQRDAAVARRWATEALEIQVEDADAHRLLAAALVELDELDRAIEEFETAIEINPAHLQQRFALANALIQAKQPAKAKKVLEELLRRDPKFPGADTLLESLNKKD